MGGGNILSIILQPYQVISKAAQITGLSERALQCGCNDGTIPHIWSRGICYVDIPALWDKLDAEQQETDAREQMHTQQNEEDEGT